MNRAALLVVSALLALSGCEQTFRDMYNQPRYKPLASSELWADGRASRAPVDGTVPYSEGAFAGSASGRLSLVQQVPQPDAIHTIRDDLRTRATGVAPAAAESVPLPPITAQLLARGRDRFNIFCSPCHSVAGDGDGMVARRGFPHPPSYHSDSLRQASDAHLYAVISNGYGAMYSYASALLPQDRLAIVAYIRALQLSQHAPFAQLDDEDRARLGALPDSELPSGRKR